MIPSPYSITVWPLPDGRWQWAVDTDDLKAHPLRHTEHGPFGITMDRYVSRVNGTRKTAEKAMTKAVDVLLEQVRRELLSKLKQSFATNAPRASARI